MVGPPGVPRRRPFHDRRPRHRSKAWRRDRALDNEVDDLRCDMAAIDESFGVLADEHIDIDRTDGARAAHLERIARR